MRLLPLALALIGCGSDSSDTGTTAAGPLATGTPAGASAAPLSHAADIQRIWNKECTPCHITKADGGLFLDDAYDQIVEVPSVDVPSMNLIEPGSPDDSYLWHKLEGSHASVGGAGFPMPRGGTLGNAKRNKIRQWIEEGAQP